MLVFILITLAVRLLSGLCKTTNRPGVGTAERAVMKANHSLEKANETINEELEHIMSYQTVGITSQDNLEGLCEFCGCASSFKNRLSFFDCPFDNKSSSIAVSSVAQPDMAQGYQS